MRNNRRFALSLVLALSIAPALAADDHFFQPADVFELEWVANPQISPDGERVVYVRGSMDVMTDQRRYNLWTVDFDGGNHRPLTSGHDNHTSPRWSPSGDRLLWVSGEGGSTQLHLRWRDDGSTARITNLTESPGGLSWSPDGKWIAFSMRVPEKDEPMATMPPKPEGAEWADPPRVIDRLIYRRDGAGYVDPGYRQVFIVPAEGGTPRQVTSGDYQHGATPEWSADGKSLLLSANRGEDWEYEPNQSEIWEFNLDGGEPEALTDRFGPDGSPALSPDGKRIAYLGNDDRFQGYQITRLYTMDRDGTGSRELAAGLDRSIDDKRWIDDQTLLVRYDDRGIGRLATVTLGGQVREVAPDVGGLSLGRPYSSGQFSSAGRRYAYTWTRPGRPAELALGEIGSEPRVVTAVNDDLLGHKELAAIETLWWKSSHDDREIQGWIAKPPGFDPEKKYPLILEIHGGPFADYGERFAAEVELYAAAGYVVLYANPRGSSSYGEEFGNLIHHAYPGNDYDDLMSGVDAVLELGYVDPERLFVTGGSGGGVLTAWIVGQTDRFRAAVSAKPVINWYSFVLTADAYNFFYKYWFPGFPWDHPEEYLRRSPLSLVGNVTTPTMLLTGEVDYRTPMSESEQYYQALMLRRVPTALVRVPGASHGIARRPSQLIAKVAHILEWFERHDTPAATSDVDAGS